MKNTLSLLRKAIDDYNMIEDGDKIAVGVSGGKDSILLLAALVELKTFYPKSFDIVPVTIDMGFENMDFSPIISFCEEHKLHYVIHKTTIADIIFNIRKEKNPCSLCARMRRGIIHDVSKENGCNKLALGHNYDDVVQTVFMNLFYEGRYGCFSPVTYLDRKDITLIRPLIFMQNAMIAQTVERLGLPVVKSTCPADKKTKREYMNNVISELSKENSDLKKNVFNSLIRGSIDKW